VLAAVIADVGHLLERRCSHRLLLFAVSAQDLLELLLGDRCCRASCVCQVLVDSKVCQGWLCLFWRVRFRPTNNSSSIQLAFRTLRLRHIGQQFAQPPFAA